MSLDKVKELFQAGKLSAALDAVEVVIADAESIEAYLLRGQIELAIGIYPDAERSGLRALRIDMSNQDAHWLCIEALEKMHGKPQQYLDNLVKLGCTSPRLFAKRVKLLLDSNNFDGASAEVSRARQSGVPPHEMALLESELSKWKRSKADEVKEVPPLDTGIQARIHDLIRHLPKGAHIVPGTTLLQAWRKLDNLVIAKTSLIACDPLCVDPGMSKRITVNANFRSGRYHVFQLFDGDVLVSAIAIHTEHGLSKAMSWEAATDLRGSPHDISIDSGMACFADGQAYEVLIDLTDSERNNLPDKPVIVFDKKTGANIVSFDTQGDLFCDCYVGKAKPNAKEAIAFAIVFS